MIGVLVVALTLAADGGFDAPCSSDGDCGKGYICERAMGLDGKAHDTCAPGCRPKAPNCPDSMTCEPYLGTREKPLYSRCQNSRGGFFSPAK